MPEDPLRADCSRCAGLCCVVPAFSASADFAISKPAGVACPNLGDDFRCRIHARLPERGFSGCVAYDCFGAGQRVIQVTHAGADWRDDTQRAAVFASFTILRSLHELTWYVREAAGLASTRELHPALHRAHDHLDHDAARPADELSTVDVDAHWREVDPLLRRASELARAGLAGPQRRGTDLIGARLRGARLRGANLRGAYLIGADLAGADLRLADLIGADLRGADLAGADLTGALFVTRAQLDSARGDARTRLPAGHTRPTAWTT